MVGNNSMPLGHFITSLHAMCIVVDTGLLKTSSRWRKWALLPTRALYSLRPVVIRESFEWEATWPDILNTILGTTICSFARPFYTATDPRDIFNGLLGILRCTKEGSSFDIQADYTQSITEVFTIMTRLFLTFTKEMFGLGAMYHKLP
ncbi:hypothetical protein QBC36DRAFT_68355 [Triangularia setosa]|uniref:Uncharacterized protein n=1 Tax=Triangularia setosa TaxID=2587417 RepID=A0AAN6VZX1_9PEZI|nr:hypothetical protein QBC36DRAFT_68355 [Podospora setosa]